MEQRMRMSWGHHARMSLVWFALFLTTHSVLILVGAYILAAFAFQRYKEEALFERVFRSRVPQTYEARKSLQSRLWHWFTAEQIEIYNRANEPEPDITQLRAKVHEYLRRTRLASRFGCMPQDINNASVEELHNILT